MSLIRDRIGWNREQQSYAVRSGVIRPVEKVPGPVAGRQPRKYAGGRGYQVTRDDAIEILIAAALALAAGVAVVVMLRAIRDAGLDASALAQAVT